MNGWWGVMNGGWRACDVLRVNGKNGVVLDWICIVVVQYII